MMVGVDATVLTLLLNEHSDSPPGPDGKPISQVRERINFLVQTLHSERQKIIVPTPVLAEVLVRAGANGLRYVDVLQKSAVFEIRAFDQLAAIELALMTQMALKSGDKRAGCSEPWQKIKLDRQIAAICKVAGVSTLYTTDGGLAHFAAEAGMNVSGVADLPLPPQSRQGNFFDSLAAPTADELDSPPAEDD